MFEWIIAMLIISVLLIIRDMAKTVFSIFRKSAATIAYDQHPQKERIEKYALSFQNLANVFYEMPCRKDYLSNGEMELLITELREKQCEKCQMNDACWQQKYLFTHEKMYHFLRLMEKGEREETDKARTGLMGICISVGRVSEELQKLIRRERTNLVWNNRLIENRIAVAEQLNEMAHIMKQMSGDLFDLAPVSRDFRETIEKGLKRKHILLQNIWQMEAPDGKHQFFLTLRMRGGQCMAVSEVASVLSAACSCPMVAKREGKSVINSEDATFRFVEDVNFKMIHGVARIIKEKESVSGDNYGCWRGEGGRYLLCLSDGMGSGLGACKESEMVVELMEQFLEAGFSEETAARMVNSALVLHKGEETFSTMDICAIDLYSGLSRFLKAGAATTFIRRDHWVEAISSTSLALGMVQQVDFEIVSKKLYDGDIIIMVTDGVLDALPTEEGEEALKEIILQTPAGVPQEMGRSILQRVLGYADYHARDDMTVLVAGIWKK